MNLSRAEIRILRNLVYLEIQSVSPWAALPEIHRHGAPKQKAELEELLHKLESVQKEHVIEI